MFLEGLHIMNGQLFVDIDKEASSAPATRHSHLHQVR
jgi:hypothetical protein